MDLQWKNSIIAGLIKENPDSTIRDYVQLLIDLQQLHDGADEVHKSLKMIRFWRPILYKPDMVRQILRGVKDVTRRVIDPQPVFSVGKGWEFTPTRVSKERRQTFRGNEIDLRQFLADPGMGVSPYGYGSADGLWVRETHRWVEGFAGSGVYVHAADQTDQEIAKNKWLPSIHMPKEACRLFQQVVTVRPERLSEITAQDAIREGVQRWQLREDGDGPVIEEVFRDYLGDRDAIVYNPLASYRSLWDYINGKGAYVTDPWVWRIEVKMTDRPEIF
jgi:hypothetical protein